MITTSSRLLTVLSLLQERPEWSGDALAQRLDVSARTVRRDVERLRELGYNIDGVKGPDGGYRLHAGNELPPLLFDDAQALALALGLQMAIRNGGDAAEAAVLALSTLRRVMPARLRHRMDALVVQAGSGPKVEPVAPALIDRLSAAVRNHELVHFDYAMSRIVTNPMLRARPRVVEAHRLVVYESRWHLVGWDVERSLWRVYRLDRIESLGCDGERFEVREFPDGGLAAFLLGTLSGGDRAANWPCRGEVVVHLAPALVSDLAHDAVVEKVDDDVSRVLVGSWSWAALAAWLLRFDADVEVVEPQELRDAFAVVAQRSHRAATSL